MAEHRPLLFFPAPVQQPRSRRPGGGGRKYGFPPRERQTERFAPQLTHLADILTEQRAALRATVEGAEPEKVLVFEIAGSVASFMNSVRKAGLEWLLDVREEDIEADDEYFVLNDEGDRKDGGRVERRLFLVMTNHSALQQMLSLWRAWSTGATLKRGYAPWGHVFAQLRNVRYWDEHDRLAGTGLEEDWSERLQRGEDRVPMEVELWFREDRSHREAAEQRVRALIAQSSGRVTGGALIEEIRYHALAGTIPGSKVEAFVSAAGQDTDLIRCDHVMFFRPSGQCAAELPGDDTQPITDAPKSPAVGEPTVALLDGMPMQQHPLLAGRLIVDDPDGFGDEYPAADRRHGTAMASLIVHGDLNDGSAQLASPLYVRPILRPTDPDPDGRVREHIPDGVLSADLMRRAVLRLFEGEDDANPVAPSVRAINLSICDPMRPFGGTMSPWARCLDWLAYRYGVLFIVSSGNCVKDLALDVARWNLTGCDADVRRDAFLRALLNDAGTRGLLAPAESMNNLTIGALHSDASGAHDLGDSFCEPFESGGLPSTYGRCGLGYRRSVKPDLLAAGGRAVYSEQIAHNGQTARAQLRDSSKAPGQAVAAPSVGRGGATWHRIGTSNAAALVTRAAAFLHASVVRPILEDSERPPMGRRHQAVFLKALIAHGAKWPSESDALRRVLMTNGLNGRAVREWMIRMYGFGVPDVDRVAYCTDQRVSLVGWSDIESEEAHLYRIPLPPSLSGRHERVRLTVTVAWFSPLDPRRQEYRRAALSIEHPDVKPQDAFGARPVDVDHDSASRGTVYHRVLEGQRASAFGDQDFLDLRVSCRPDAGGLDEAVPYALAVTLEVAEETALPIYEEVRARVGIPVSVRA